MSSWRGLGRSLIRTRRPIERLSRVLTLPTPAVGADWAVQVPGGRAWRILALNAVYTPSATAGTRAPDLHFSTSDGVFLSVGCGGTDAPSTVLNYSYMLSSCPAAVPVTHLTVTAPLPNIWLIPGTVVGSSTDNLANNDQWGPVVLYVDEILGINQTIGEYLAEEQADIGDTATLTITAFGA